MGNDIEGNKHESSDGFQKVHGISVWDAFSSFSGSWGSYKKFPDCMDASYEEIKKNIPSIIKIAKVMQFYLQLIQFKKKNGFL
jgi:hypothetical protein